MIRVFLKRLVFSFGPTDLTKVSLANTQKCTIVVPVVVTPMSWKWINTPIKFLLFLYINISLVSVVMSSRKSLSCLGCTCTVCS